MSLDSPQTPSTPDTEDIKQLLKQKDREINERNRLLARARDTIQNLQNDVSLSRLSVAESPDTSFHIASLQIPTSAAHRYNFSATTTPRSSISSPSTNSVSNINNSSIGAAVSSQLYYETKFRELMDRESGYIREIAHLQSQLKESQKLLAEQSNETHLKANELRNCINENISLREKIANQEQEARDTLLRYVNTSNAKLIEELEEKKRLIADSLQSLNSLEETVQQLEFENHSLRQDIQQRDETIQQLTKKLEETSNREAQLREKLIIMGSPRKGILKTPTKTNNQVSMTSPTKMGSVAFASFTNSETTDSSRQGTQTTPSVQQMRTTTTSTTTTPAQVFASATQTDTPATTEAQQVPTQETLEWLQADKDEIAAHNQMLLEHQQLLYDKIRAQEETCVTLNSTVEDLQSQISQYKDQIEEMREKHREKENADKRNFYDELTQVRKDAMKLAEQRDIEKQRSSDRELEIQERESEIKQLKNEIETLQQEMNEKNEKLADTENRIQLLESIIETRDADINQLHQEIHDLRQRIGDLSAALMHGDANDSASAPKSTTEAATASRKRSASAAESIAVSSGTDSHHEDDSRNWTAEEVTTDSLAVDQKAPLMTRAECEDILTQQLTVHISNSRSYLQPIVQHLETVLLPRTISSLSRTKAFRLEEECELIIRKVLNGISVRYQQLQASLKEEAIFLFNKWYNNRLYRQSASRSIATAESQQSLTEKETKVKLEMVASDFAESIHRLDLALSAELTSLCLHSSSSGSGSSAVAIRTSDDIGRFERRSKETEKRLETIYDSELTLFATNIQERLKSEPDTEQSSAVESDIGKEAIGTNSVSQTSTSTELDRVSKELSDLRRRKEEFETALLAKLQKHTQELKQWVMNIDNGQVNDLHPIDGVMLEVASNSAAVNKTRKTTLLIGDSLRELKSAILRAKTEFYRLSDENAVLNRTNKKLKYHLHQQFYEQQQRQKHFSSSIGMPGDLNASPIAGHGSPENDVFTRYVRRAIDEDHEENQPAQEIEALRESVEKANRKVASIPILENFMSLVMKMVDVYFITEVDRPTDLQQTEMSTFTFTVGDDDDEEDAYSNNDGSGDDIHNERSTNARREGLEQKQANQNTENKPRREIQRIIQMAVEERDTKSTLKRLKLLINQHRDLMEFYNALRKELQRLGFTSPQTAQQSLSSVSQESEHLLRAFRLLVDRFIHNSSDVINRNITNELALSTNRKQVQQQQNNLIGESSSSSRSDLLLLTQIRLIFNLESSVSSESVIRKCNSVYQIIKQLKTLLNVQKSNQIVSRCAAIVSQMQKFSVLFPQFHDVITTATAITPQQPNSTALLRNVRN